jgi:hypothetical protein
LSTSIYIFFYFLNIKNVLLNDGKFQSSVQQDHIPLKDRKYSIQRDHMVEEMVQQKLGQGPVPSLVLGQGPVRELEQVLWSEPWWVISLAPWLEHWSVT